MIKKIESFVTNTLYNSSTRWTSSFIKFSRIEGISKNETFSLTVELFSYMHCIQTYNRSSLFFQQNNVPSIK